MTQTDSAPSEAATDDSDAGGPNTQCCPRRHWRRRASALVAAAFGVVALVDASGLKVFGDKGVPGPGFFPMFPVGCGHPLGLLQVAVSVARGVRRGAGSTRVRWRGVSAEVLRAAYVWLGFLVSIALMPLAGFVPATMLLIAYLVVRRRADQGHQGGSGDHRRAAAGLRTVRVRPRRGTADVDPLRGSVNACPTRAMTMASRKET